MLNKDPKPAKINHKTHKNGKFYKKKRDPEAYKGQT